MTAGIRSQTEFAQRIKGSQQTVCRWEAGTSRPREKDLPVIAGVLDVSVDELRVAAGYALKTAVKTFDEPFPVDALLPESFERFCAYLLGWSRTTVKPLTRLAAKGNASQAKELAVVVPKHCGERLTSCVKWKTLPLACTFQAAELDTRRKWVFRLVQKDLAPCFL